jgi:predicted amidohydrolase
MIVRVAAVQAEPVHLDLRATLERTRLLLAQAAAQGARVVAFPETWLPGYPAWLDCCRDVGLWDHAPMKQVFVRLRENAVVVPGPATAELGALAAEHDVVLNVGVQERVDEGPGRGTLYNAMLTFGADGTLVNHYRKLMPTFTERLVWGSGNGSGLRAVATDRGRIGGLICWEHWMPLARQVLHDSGEDIHIAAWPQLKEMNLVASRHYAFEGRCYVIACGALMRAGSLPAELETPAAFGGRTDALVLRGGSAIIAPDGSLLAGPVLDDEAVLVADLDLGRIAAESLTLDVTGHYQRPDVFELRLKAR